MGTISNARAYYGLTATGTPTKTRVDGTSQIGVGATISTLTGAGKFYVVSAKLASNMDSLSIDLSTGIATGSTTPVAQVETATVVAASGATGNGNLAVTVTGARITGSPLVIAVPLTMATHTADTIITGAIGAAFNDTPAITAIYAVIINGTNVRLQEKDPQNNDPTLNIAITAGLGVSAVASSTNTTAGVGGVKITNRTGDGNDFEGVPLSPLGDTIGLLIKGVGGEVGATVNGSDLGSFVTGEFQLIVKPSSKILNPIIMTASGEDAEVEITICTE